MSRSTPVSDPTKFSRFVTCLVFSLLKRNPKVKSEKALSVYSSPPRETSCDLMEVSSQISMHAPLILYSIHQILKATSRFIPLPTVLTALLYVSRIYEYKIKIPSHGSEAHLFCICLILAQKTSDDHAFKNKTWSRITKMPVAMINEMERECLQGLGYNLYIKPAEFEKWHHWVQNKAVYWNQIYTITPKSVVPNVMYKRHAAPCHPPSSVRCPKKSKSLELM